ncbi:MAG: hypothetical protein HZA54_09145 [Planctomycetes bacterium]|nr:hypothetical protein [Planctomycetota bacterium]
MNPHTRDGRLPRIAKALVSSALLLGLCGLAPSAYAHPPGNPDVARTIYREALRAHASEKVKVAMFEAAVVESGMRNLTYGDRDSIGVFQLRVGIWGYATASSVTRSARWFLNRAIPREHRYSTPGRLAQAVEVSAYPYRYDQARGTAMAWLRYVRGY